MTKKHLSGLLTLAVALAIVAANSAVAQTNALSDGGSTPAVAHNTWSLGTPMPTARFAASAGAIGTNIYVVGGLDQNNDILSVNEIYNTKTKIWTTGTSDPTPRGICAYAVVNGILYVIGGYNGGPLDVAEAYDPVSNSWATKSPMPTSRWGASAVVDKNIIYVIGGTPDLIADLTTVESYNTTTDTWTEEPSLLFPKAYAAVGLLGTTIVASGGYNGSEYTGDTEGYNVKKKTWTELLPDPYPRGGACFSVKSGLLYVAGGTDGPYAELSVNESYSLKANSWTTLTPMPNAANYPASADVGGRLYCIGGGIYEQVVYNYVQVYQP